MAEPSTSTVSIYLHNYQFKWFMYLICTLYKPPKLYFYPYPINTKPVFFSRAQDCIHMCLKTLSDPVWSSSSGKWLERRCRTYFWNGNGHEKQRAPAIQWYPTEYKFFKIWMAVFCDYSQQACVNKLLTFINTEWTVNTAI